MKYVFLFLSCLCTILGWSQRTFGPMRPEIDVTLLAPASATTRAVVIGVGAFDSPDIPSLPGVADDARRFADSLQRAGITGEQMILLTDQQATAAQIAAALDGLLDRCQPGDRALIYLGGYWAREGHGDYFIAYDAPHRVFMAGGTIPAHWLDDVFNSLRHAQVQTSLIKHTTAQAGSFKD